MCDKLISEPVETTSDSKTVNNGAQTSDFENKTSELNPYGNNVKTISTQCGGEHVDDENILVGKLSYSPLPPEMDEKEDPCAEVDDQDVEMEPSATDFLNKVCNFL